MGAVFIFLFYNLFGGFLLFWPSPLIKKKPLKAAILFSDELASMQFVLSELGRRKALARKIDIVVAFTNKIKAKAIDLLALRHVECRIVDEEMFLSKRKNMDKKKAIDEYFERITNELAEFEPSLIINDNFGIESTELATRLKLPVLECSLISRKGRLITRFQGRNVVRSAILAGKRVLQAGAFLAKPDSLYLVVTSRRLPLDLKRLAHINDSAEFEKYVDIFSEKFKWSCSGPCILKALELISEQRIGHRFGTFYIKEKERWEKGFYNMETDSIENVKELMN